MLFQKHGLNIYVNFRGQGPLNANCSNMVKDTDFPGRLGQFGHDPLKNFQKLGVPRVTFPYIFGR